MSAGQEVSKGEGQPEGSPPVSHHEKEIAGEEDNSGPNQRRDDTHTHEDYTPSTDPNAYRLGSIYGLNVVIAGLPLAGNTFTASVVAHMVNTFPRLRFSLLVGIGGGVPIQPDEVSIRLGHVVVSNPEGQHSGAVQFDHGKAEAGEFRRTGFLAPPPNVLLNAASRMNDARQLALTDPLIAHLRRINTSRPRLRRYKYSGEEEDRLYQPDYVHLNRAANCNQCGCDPERIVARDCDNIDDEIGIDGSPEYVVVHRGTIAAGEKVMRNGIERDLLAKDLGVLCFEMEAAGALNTFPCLVIRGISDYADSHKNNKWQGYAAAVAAAYARELFRHMPIDEVKQCKIPESVVKQVAADSRFVASKTREAEILQWLAPADFSTNYNQACALHHPGTGQWFLENEPYQRWKSLEDAALWLHGGSGCGKTVLSSAIITDLKTANSPVVYFFFDVNDSNKQSFDTLLRSLIFQLYMQAPAARTQLDTVCEGHQQPQTPALLAVWTAMASIVDNVYIVVDALDECKDWKDLLYQLPSIKCKHVRMLLTSRTEQEIESSLRRWVPGSNIVSVSQSPIDDDIRKVVRMRIAESQDLQDRWRAQPEVLTTIESKLMDRADGMFRLVVCQLDVLQDCLDRKSLDKALRDLPKTLAGIYTRILHNIPDGHREHAIRLLQFLLYADFAEEPLRLEEAVDAIAVEPDETPAFRAEHRMPEPEEIARYCSSLTKLTIGEGAWRNSDGYAGSVVHIQLAHASVNEYLASELVPVSFRSHLEDSLAHEAIVSVCVAYLITAAESSEPSHSVELPFVYFCARYWLRHAHEVEERNPESSTWAVALFTSQKVCAYWLSCPGFPEPVRHRMPSKLYLACMGGLPHTASMMLEQGADVNTQGGFYGNALVAAVAHRHVRIVRLLLDNNANVDNNSLSGGYHQDYPNALYLASEAGHETLVRLLLERHPDVNAYGGNFGSALNVACRGAYTGIVKLLLEAGADVDNEGVRQGGHHSTLTAACSSGDEAIVRMLIEKGANVIENDGSALAESILFGPVAMTQILLEHGADVNAQSDKYGNALIAACFRAVGKDGDDDEVVSVVRLLLENGAEVDYARQHDKYPNALYVAARNGQIEIVQLFLRHGAHVNTQGGADGSAFNAALWYGHESIAQLLLTHGADVHIHGPSGNALTAAARGGCEVVVRLLLESGADVNAPGEIYGTPLQAACLSSLSCESCIAIVHLLLEWGADINAQAGRCCESALQGAVGWNAIPLVEILIERGADMNAPGGLVSALQAAVKKSDEDMVRLLLERGADINALGDAWGSTALMTAARYGFTEIVRLLLEEGADPNVHGGRYGNALNAARSDIYSDNGQEITQMLLAAGAVDYGPEEDWDSTETQTSPTTTEFHLSHRSVCPGRPRQVLERLRKSGLMGRQRRRLGKKYAVVLRWRATTQREYHAMKVKKNIMISQEARLWEDILSSAKRRTSTTGLRRRPERRYFPDYPYRSLRRLRMSGLMGRQGRRLGKKRTVVFRGRDTTFREYSYLEDKLGCAFKQARGKKEGIELWNRLLDYDPDEAVTHHLFLKWRPPKRR
ncbi:hypothetical protein LTS10_005966 [Elasticomyces elasticus]|nr:hypothetical protein LTS10_005966 [Elasticomyces elasticus]